VKWNGKPVPTTSRARKLSANKSDLKLVATKCYGQEAPLKGGTFQLFRGYWHYGTLRVLAICVC